MEYTSLVDTSLDLNLNPRRFVDETLPPKQEVRSNFMDNGRKFSEKEESGALVEELNRVSAENRKLTEMLTVMCENYNSLRSQLMEYTSKNGGGGEVDTTSPKNIIVATGRKRKVDSSYNNINNNGANNVAAALNSESSSSDEDSYKKPTTREEHIKAKVSRVFVQTEASDTTSLIVKDGYQWRKYGQKVTRDNPSPRAYFKCSFAPTCPVKKKVQRSVEDQSIVVATYEGEHNHPHPTKMEAAATSSSNRCVTPLGSVPCSAAIGSSGSTITLDLTKPRAGSNNSSSNNKNNNIVNDEPKFSSRRVDSSTEFPRFLAEQMASSLTKDPSFKAALAAAISGRITPPNNYTQKW